MKFIDDANIYIKAGDGGPGHVSFRKEKFVPKGGPDGGTGGKGGDVVFVASRNMSTLLDLKFIRSYAADDGKPGGKSRKTGKNAKNIEILVPVGTIIKNAETEEIMCDLAEDGQRAILAKGGIGGKGNAEFATPTKRVPQYAQPGIPGEEFNVYLELKLIADVGLVGFPNAGKSTLISVLSSAKPKIADYPFTTLIPNLGIVRAEDYKSFVIADIPGIIEGASQGKGLGIQFLRHIERTKMLVFLIDANSDDPLKDYEVLNNELNEYSELMRLKERIICFSKLDAITPERAEELEQIDFGQFTPMPISAVSHLNMDKLKFLIMQKLGY